MLLLACCPLWAQGSTTGTYNALVVFARFADEATGDVIKPPWADDLFDPGVKGSFTHFYNEMSGGQLRVGGEVLPRRYASRLPASAYLSRTPGTLGEFARFNVEILEQADADVDMGRFDNDGPDGVPNSGDDDGYVDILFINLLTVPRDFLIGGATGLASLGLNTDFLSGDVAAGGGVIRVRNQYSGFSGTTQRGHVFTVTAATMCHEFAHVLGLPDLFDQSSLTADGKLEPVADSAGIGKWGLMGLGTLGWGIEDGPNAFSAWSLAQLGWLGVDNENLEVITDSRTGIVLEPTDRGGHVLKIPLTRDEYFLIENRQSTDSFYNRNIPGGGLLVWHVDERADNDEERHKQVDLVCADGLFGDAGFPGARADPTGGGDNLDFWARDATYANEHNGNQGDASDPFDGIRYRRMAWDTNPGARAHAGGRRGIPVGLVLENITNLGGGRMGLDVLLRQPLSGNVSRDTTWTGSVSLDGDLIVEPGATLVLAAGSQVSFAPGDTRGAGFDTTRSEIVVYGELVVAGTMEDPVRIGRQNTTGRRWLGVLVPGAGSAGLEAAIEAGALILEGARLGLIRGRLPAGRTTWTGTRTIPWDVMVPAGAELFVDAGAVVRFAPQDLSLRGVSPESIELVVEGGLVVRGSRAAPASFTVDSAAQDELWYGVQIVPGGEVDVEGLNLTQARAGFIGDVTAGFRLADSQLQRLLTGLSLTIGESGTASVDRVDLRTISTNAIQIRGSGRMVLRSSVVEGNGREGVRVRSAGMQIIDSRISSNGSLDPEDPRSGFVAEGGRGQRIELWNTTVDGNRQHGIDLDKWQGVFELHGSTVSGNRADGLRAKGAERIVFEEVEVARNLSAGARLSATTAEVWTTSFDNNVGAGLIIDGGFPSVDMSHFSGNGLELHNVAAGSVRGSDFDNTAVALLSVGSAPQVVGNTFTGNITALRVSGSPVPDPIEGNTFVSNTTAIDNRSGVPLVARGNYWGTTDSTAIAGLLVGEVDFSSYLDGEPKTAVTAAVDESLPGTFALRKAWPNPFNATTTIAFDLPTAAAVDLAIHDILGQRVRDLTPASSLVAGRYTVRWDGRDDRGRGVASGIYFYHLRTDIGFRAAGRVVLTR